MTISKGNFDDSKNNIENYLLATILTTPIASTTIILIKLPTKVEKGDDTTTITGLRDDE